MLINAARYDIGHRLNILVRHDGEIGDDRLGVESQAGEVRLVHHSERIGIRTVRRSLSGRCGRMLLLLLVAPVPGGRWGRSAIVRGRTTVLVAVIHSSSEGEATAGRWCDAEWMYNESRWEKAEHKARGRMGETRWPQSRQPTSVCYLC